MSEEQQKKVNAEELASVEEPTDSLGNAEQILVLENQIKTLEQQVKENRNALISSLAEIENLRKRTEKEVSNAHKYAIEKFLKELLGVVDNLERSLLNRTVDVALQPMYQGVELTLKSLMDLLKKYGVVVIDPLNELFNPEQHNAVTVKLVDGVVTNTVVEVIQKGYWLKDRVLRPAMVVVAQ